MSQIHEIKVFFFHDQIENITEEVNVLVLTFENLAQNVIIAFDLDVSVFVNKDFEPVTFKIANSTYQK